MTAESPLTSVDFMSDGGTLAVGSTRGLLTKLTTYWLLGLLAINGSHH